MTWRLSYKADPEALRLANRHYNRQSHDSPQFMPPGRTLVLVTDGAVWGSLSQDHADHAWPGAWVCSIFRNESTVLSSSLIVEAVAATTWAWGGAPSAGFLTFVDPGKTRRKRDPGRCFRRAGWEHVACTMGGHGRSPLAVLWLAPENFPAPRAPIGWQEPLFAAVGR